VDILDDWSGVWTSYEQDDLCHVDRSADRVELTRAGLLQVDSLLPRFFEPHHQGIRYT
jgi:oxygen-independent coproporphyrinogen-3 oxidase